MAHRHSFEAHLRGIVQTLGFASNASGTSISPGWKTDYPSLIASDPHLLRDSSGAYYADPYGVAIGYNISLHFAYPTLRADDIAAANAAFDAFSGHDPGWYTLCAVSPMTLSLSWAFNAPNSLWFSNTNRGVPGCVGRILYTPTP